MSKSFRKDLTGQRFGRLTVLEFVSNEYSKSYWRCQCDCGNEIIASGSNLKSENVQSCGCKQQEKRFMQIHGKAKTRLYSVWKSMKHRCYNIKDKNYKHYGKRGIMVCDEWQKDFQAFYDWAMSSGYKDTLTIDRIDVNGNYEPLNCRWVDMKTQARNKTNNVMIECKGATVCLTEAADILGISKHTLRSRYRNGKRGTELVGLTKSENRGRKAKYLIEYNGEMLPLYKVAEIVQKSYATLYKRYRNGLRGEELLK